MYVPCTYLPIHGSKQPATYILTGLREPETLLGLFAPAMKPRQSASRQYQRWKTPSTGTRHFGGSFGVKRCKAFAMTVYKQRVRLFK